jgi:excinuclease UvrABC nuclease subunit
MFMKLRPFTAEEVGAVPAGPGIYIIYLADGTPFYVGRSLTSIHERLWNHVNCTGSRKVAEARNQGRLLKFEFQEMWSVEQAEAALIDRLGTRAYGNLRREIDPADR